ncbi:MAG: response regulator [Limisphaerales bacterium]
MKKILIVEDDHIVATVYRNKLAAQGYQTEIAFDGETGLALTRTFRPDAVILDLILPNMPGVDVIKQLRAETEFSKLPIIVFSNAYLTDSIQEAWKAGATKCVAKTSCSPKEMLSVVQDVLGGSGAAFTGESDTEFQSGLRKTFIDSLPATLIILRAELQNLIKSGKQTTWLEQIYELYRRIHALNSNAGVVGLVQIANMAAALEALLKELYEKPENVNTSTLRTITAAVDFLGFLFENGTAPDKQEIPTANILVVDDEPISRRAVVYALEKAHLKSVSVEDPDAALKLLEENDFDLIFLDVDMPGINGIELCAKLRALPRYKTTPVVFFVTILGDFDNRANSAMAGGNDFIAKPFLFIELTVKALIYVLRCKLQPVK